MMILFMLAGLAHAAKIDPPDEVSLSALGMFEVWQDTAIPQIYHPSRVLPVVAIDADIDRPWFVRTSLGYLRMTGGEPAAEGEEPAPSTGPVLEMVPTTLGLGLRLHVGSAELRPSISGALTHFAESSDTAAVTGDKLGWEGQVEIRLPTSLSLDTLHKDEASRRTELTFVAARRAQSLLSDQGFDLSAWRVGLGLVLVP